MTTGDSERLILLGLNATLAVGMRDVERWRKGYGSLATFTAGVGRTAAATADLPEALRVALAEGSLPDRGRRDLADAERLGAAVFVHGDDSYPKAFLTLHNPPIAVFVLGRPPEVGAPLVAVVGSRNCSRYGARTARTMARDLAVSGVAIVSGLARGVDTEAHRGALEGGAPTYGVLGCGLADVYPNENRALALEIVRAGGAVISEFPPSTPPLPHHFPRRNRLIAAFADALVVVEARAKSGALITARWATDLGKDVFVLPGQVDSPTSEGTLELLRDGATLVRGAEDLLQDLSWSEGEAPKGNGAASDESFSPEEQALLALLDHEPRAFEDLLQASGRGAGETLTRLLALELRGAVEQGAGMTFRRVSAKG